MTDLTVTTKANVDISVYLFGNEMFNVDFTYFGRYYKYTYKNKFSAYRKFIELRNLFNSVE